MDQIADTLIQYVNIFASSVPLPVFVFLGSFLEDIIAPIPSPMVMTLSGTLAQTRQYGILQIILLLLLSALGKTIGGYILYIVADKVEDVIPQKIRKIMGISHTQIEAMGAKIGKGRRDDIILFILRAVPAMPSLPVSLAAGILKINMNTYLWTTFLGTVVKNGIYFVIGYSGKEVMDKWSGKLSDYELAIQIIILASVVVGVAWYLYKRNRK